MKPVFILIIMCVNITVFAQRITVNVVPVGSNSEFIKTDYYNKTDIQDSASSIINYHNIIKKPYINVHDYGAKGNGQHDDAVNIYNAAIAARDKNMPLVFPSGNYKINSRIWIDGYSNDNNFNWIGLGRVTIDCSGIAELGGNIYFYFQSDTMNRKEISADINNGDSVIHFNNTDWSLDIGDIVYVRSTELWDEGELPWGGKGEMLMVKRIIDTNTIVVFDGIIDNYSENTSSIQWVKSGKFNWENIDVIGSTDIGKLYVGLHCKYFRDISIKNSNFTNIYQEALNIDYVYGGVIDNVSSLYSPMKGQGYSIAIGPSVGVTVQNCRLQGSRHGITTTQGFPIRFLTIRNNYVSTDWQYQAAIDNHAALENCIIDGNTVIGGSISTRGKNVKVINNTIIRKQGNSSGGIFFNLFTYPQKGDYYIATGNTITTINSGNDSIYSVGIGVNIIRPNDTISYINISHNKIQGGWNGISISTTYDNDSIIGYIDNINISNNDIRSTYYGGNAISVQNRIKINTLNIHDNNLKSEDGYGLKFTGTLKTPKNTLLFSNNIVSYKYGAVYLYNTIFEDIDISFNKFTAKNTGSYIYGLFADSCVTLRINNNVANQYNNYPFYRTSKAGTVFTDSNYPDSVLYNQWLEKMTYVHGNVKWTTAYRPANPSVGSYGYNTTENKMEYWNGSLWVQY